MEKRGGNQIAKSSKVTLLDSGISKQLSQRSQTIASVPKEDLERRIEAAKRPSGGSDAMKDDKPPKLCPRCGKRPCYRSRTRHGGYSWLCWRCEGALKTSSRLKRWASGERPACQNHPDKVVNRSNWVHRGQRLCASCLNRSTPSRRHHRSGEWVNMARRVYRIRKRLRSTKI